MRHVHLMDPQLSGLGGHYHNHDAQLLTELQRRGIPASLYGKKNSQVPDCAGVPITPAFTLDIFQEAATDATTWPMENFHAINDAFFAELIAIDPARFSADDFVYFPNILQNQVHAVSRWLAQLPAANRPAVALMFRYLNHAMDYIQQRQNKDMIALYYRFAVRQLLASHPRTLICADTTELANAYRQMTGAPVTELPNPMDVSALLAAPAAKENTERPVIVYQGHTSPLRGFHFLPDIVERCVSLNPRPLFVVQVQNRAGAASTGLTPTLQRLDRMNRGIVELVEGSLSSADYLALMARADIVLLPYTPTFYGAGSSGVFTEAASAGKVVVACEGTVPARQGKEYQLGVVSAEKWTPQSMATAVSQALKNLPALRAQAEAGAPRFREENCARAFWERLLAAAATLPVPAIAG